MATSRLPRYSGRVVGCCIGLSKVPLGRGLLQSAKQTVPNDPSPTSLMTVKSRGPSRISEAAVVGICVDGGGASDDVEAAVLGEITVAGMLVEGAPIRLAEPSSLRRQGDEELEYSEAIAVEDDGAAALPAGDNEADDCRSAGQD